MTDKLREKQNIIAHELSNPDIRHAILRDYKGAYDIGLTLDPANRDNLTVTVSIEGKDRGNIPSEIELAGHAIPIVVRTDFQPPKALAMGTPIDRLRRTE